MPFYAERSSNSTYVQTNATVSRTHAKATLSTNITGLVLLTEVIDSLETTNDTVNEVKQLVNALIDDLQTAGVVL